MSFDDFKKSDLDFDSLISSTKSQKKYPKSSEGLRFLTRNLKVDADKRNEIHKLPNDTVVESSIDESTTPLPSSLNSEIQRQAVAESSIDISATEVLGSDVVKTSIDEITTHKAQDKSVANSSIDKITTDSGHKSSSANENSFLETSLNNSELIMPETQHSAHHDHSSVVEIQSEPKIETHVTDADYHTRITKQISNVAKTSIDINTTVNATHGDVVETSIDGITTEPNQKTTTKQPVVISSIDKNATVKNQATRITLKGNYTKVSHHILASFKNLQKSESLVYLYLYRQSYGWNRNTTQMTSIRHVANQLCISTRTVQDSIKALVEKNFIVPEANSSFKINIITDSGISNEVPKNNFLMLDNNFFALPEDVSITERLVYFYLYRFTFGFGRRSTEALVKTKNISLCLNLSIRRLQDALRALISRGLIQRESEISSLGFIFSVKLPHEIYPELTRTEYVANSSIDTNATEEKTTTDNSATERVIKTSTDENTTEEIPVNLQYVERGVVNTSMDDNATNKDINTKTNIKKSSSGLDDEVFNFLIQETKKHSGFSFTISRNKVSELVKTHEPEKLKSAFKKMLPVLLREDTANPVGLYLHALEEPDSYSVLQKPSAQELADQKRYENLIGAREKFFVEEFKQILEKKIKAHWQNITEQEQGTWIAQRRAQSGEQGSGFTIPETVIRRSAMENAFWESHQKSWLQLPVEDRQGKLSKAKRSIIERVYAKGEGRAGVPELLPEREFLKLADEIAEKLAMMSVGRTNKT